uniref:Peptidase_M16 domain-containing protein n=1 Tax=Syphacia muris TaxID=451379 RepID=A0A0N5A852_9BILA
MLRFSVTVANTTSSIHFTRCNGLFSQMRNGMAVYTTDYGGPIAQLLLAFRAGSRYEESDESGVAHHLLNSVGSDSEDSPGSDLLNQCSSLGNSHLTREIFAVQATVVRENAVRMAPVLTELCHLAIKPWDFDNINDAVKKEVLYKEPHKMLLNCLYHQSRLVSGQAAFIGINVDHLNLLERLEEGVKIREEAGKYGIQSEYFGGEARRQLNSSKAYVAIAGEGASFQDPEVIFVLFCHIRMCFALTMAIMECLLKSESSSDTAFWYATQLLGCRKVRSPAEFASLIKEVTKEDVDRVKLTFLAFLYKRRSKKES